MMANRTIYVPNDRIWELAKGKASSEGRSISQVIDRCLREYIIGKPVTREQRIARACKALVDAGLPVEKAVEFVLKMDEN